MQEIKHVHTENTPQFCRFRTEFSPQCTSQTLFWMWILLFWVWFSSFLNVGKAIFNIVFACSSAVKAVSADVKCWYKVLICCKMEVRTVECFVKFGKSGLETPETHHATAVIALPFRYLGNQNAGNKSCTRRKYTIISPFPHRIFTANKPATAWKTGEIEQSGF